MKTSGFLPTFLWQRKIIFLAPRAHPCGQASLPGAEEGLKWGLACVSSTWNAVIIGDSKLGVA